MKIILKPISTGRGTSIGPINRLRKYCQSYEWVGRELHLIPKRGCKKALMHKLKIRQHYNDMIIEIERRR